MFMLVMLCRHLAVPPCPVHRVDIGIEEDLVEVPDDDGQRGQDGFVKWTAVATSTHQRASRLPTHTLAHIITPVSPMRPVPHTSAQYSAFSP